MSDGQEKTEKATPRKRKKAWREGGISNTPEFGTWLGLFAASYVLPWVFTSLFATAQTALVEAGATIHPIRRKPSSSPGVTSNRPFAPCCRSPA
jgi:flagellar biosynthesis protein FlhB